jgi:hypothetical protein
MDAMVERVAKAMAEPYMWVVRTPAALKREPWREFIPAARAAIEAMREPTEAMENAAITYNDSSILLMYEAMIDAALGEPAKAADPGIPIYATTEGPKETFQGKRKG